LQAHSLNWVAVPPLCVGIVLPPHLPNGIFSRSLLRSGGSVGPWVEAEDLHRG